MNKSLFFVIVFILTLLMCGLFDASGVLASEDEKLLEYCKQPAKPRPQIKMKKSTGKSTTESPPKREPKIERASIYQALKGCNLHSQIIPGNKSMARVVLVPVGYDNPDFDLGNRMREFVDVLATSYRKVGVRFSFANCSVPMTIRVHGKTAHLDFTEVGKVENWLRSAGIDMLGVVFVANNKDHFGISIKAGSSVVAAVAGETKSSYYILVHEVAHQLSLNDGYRSSKNRHRYTHPQHKGEGPGRTVSGINGTELFLRFSQLREDVKDAYHQLRPKIVQIGLCRGDSLYTFRSSSTKFNIMQESLPNNKFLELLEEGVIPFSDLQIMIMNNFLKEKYSKPR